MPLSFVNELEFVYVQSTGHFYLRDTENVRALIARGYSGRGEWRDSPEAEHLVGKGPIPRGLWTIQAPIRSAAVGPHALPLRAHGPTHGRSAFLIHGDNAKGDASASRGCIILPRSAREFISGSGVKKLTVE